jgi:hypothetical protein
VAAVALSLGAAVAIVSCSSTPTPVPIRTFERPQKLAVVCLGVNVPDGAPATEVTPLPLAACPPVPPTIIGAPFQNHIIALVTQQTRGQLAAVDLTAGHVVDEDLSTPGTNFIPVGASPTDVVVTPDVFLEPGSVDAGAEGTSVPPFAFVSSAAPNSFAIYAIPSAQLLGDSTGVNTQPPELTTILACSLPQPPQALGVAIVGPATGGINGGTPEGGPPHPPYVVVALLRAFLGAPARVVAIDPTPFSGSIEAGALPPCTILGGTALSGDVPSPVSPATPWPDGIPYADAGDLQATEPPLGPSCALATSGPDAMAEGGAVDDAGADAIVEAGEIADAGADAIVEAGEIADAGADAIVEGGAVADAAATAEAGADATVEGGAVAVADAAGNTMASGSSGGIVNGGAALPPLGPAHPTAMVLRDDAPIAYVADDAVPVIHVVDLSDPTAPHEVGQFIATSQANPQRQVQVGGLALSPPTSDFRRYLYAIDASEGSLMVFDASQPMPSTPSQSPLVRPHAELNPFVTPDRIAFAAPVAAVTFVLHDWPLVPPAPNTDQVHSYTGLLCNPNPNAAGSVPNTFVDGGLGGYYRADQASVIQPQGSGVQSFPTRLRGVFGFATLSNGSIVVIDVDDWDAPCRRPDPMDSHDGGPDFQLGALDLPEPAPADSNDIAPYHAPRTVVNGNSGVTQEVFFPVSAPNRLRSSFLLRNDPTSGEHIPFVSTVPQLFDSAGSPVSYMTGGPVALLLPTGLPQGFADPTYIENPTDVGLNYSYLSPALGTASGQAGAGAAALFPGAAQTVPGVRVSLDDPTAHIDQDWSVTYEGVLPTANGIFADIVSQDASFQTLTFAPAPASGDAAVSNGAQFCERGIEDWNQGQLRATAALAAMSAAGYLPPTPPPPAPPPYLQRLGEWTADYVEIVDDLLGSGDPYWSAPNDCWDGLTVTGGTRLDDDAGSAISAIASTRYNACFQTFNSASNADSNYTRDFPILQATDNALEVGRFAWPPSSNERPNNRTVVGRDPSNAPYLRLAACCFHRQASFKVRAGGEWLTVGQVGQNPGVGLLHHVVAEPGTGACVVGCDDPTKVLLNARAFEVPPPASACNPAMGSGAFPTPIDRSSALAMRNPMFSFVMWGGCGIAAPADGGFLDENGTHTVSARDQRWQFSLRGGFTPEAIPLQGTSAVPVSPQSMLYVAPFAQLAVVDGAQNGQGLVLIDVNTLTFAHAPYF